MLGERFGELDGKLDQLRDRRRELTEAFDELEGIQEDLKRLESGESDRRDREDLQKARNRHVELNKLEARIKTAKAELELGETRLDQSSRAVKERERLRQSIADQEQGLKNLDERLSFLGQEENAARELCDSARYEARKLEKSLEDSNATESRQKRVLAAARRRERLRELEQRRDQAIAAEDRLRESERSAAAISITPESLAAIRKADAAMKDSENRLNAAATRIGFEMEPEGAQGITINGEPLATGRQPFRR